MLRLRKKRGNPAHIRRHRGNETIQMLATSLMLTLFILVAFMFFTYITETMLCTFATRRAAERIEVMGVYDRVAVEETLESIMPPNGVIELKNVQFECDEYIHGNKIRLSGVFSLRTEWDYKLKLVNPGSFEGFVQTLPIISVVQGMSEVHWSEGSGYSEISRY